jgi:hypothetical protein
MRFASLSAFVLSLACACSGSSSPEEDMIAADLTAPVPRDLAPLIDMLPIDYDAGLPSGPNIVPLVLDGFGTGANVGFITITVCAPGTSTCQTIDHVLVDTGSVGLRIVNEALSAPLLAALPTIMVGGNPVSECYVYAGSYVYGSVRTADVTIGGELAAALPINIAGDLSPTPASCDPGGESRNTIVDMGGKGIIGLAGLSPDCGAACTTSPTTEDGVYYYGCTGGTCTPVGVPLAQQVPNPVVEFATDNNGYIVALPAVSDIVGAVNPEGTITFGIGTQSNNALTSQKVYEADVMPGFVPTLSSKVDATSFEEMVFDTGTPYFALTLSGITECTGMLQGFYCPASLQALTANLTGKNGATGAFDFKIANGETLVDGAADITALDDIAIDLGSQYATLFISGMPGFFGRRLFFGIAGKNAGSHAGPFYAF